MGRCCTLPFSNIRFYYQLTIPMTTKNSKEKIAFKLAMFLLFLFASLKQFNRFDSDASQYILLADRCSTGKLLQIKFIVNFFSVTIFCFVFMQLMLLLVRYFDIFSHHFMFINVKHTFVTEFFKRI